MKFFINSINTGILAIAIMALGIAIIVYPTLRKHSGKKK
jgi:hypothetical protein